MYIRAFKPILIQKTVADTAGENMIRNNLILYALLLTKMVIQYYAIDPVYELHRDEFLHLDLGKHLAWGYTSVPPATGVISAIILLLGNSVFWVKFFPALFGALTAFLTWKIVEELQGGLFACILATVSVIFSVLLRINTLYQPNSLDFLLWTMMFYIFVKYIKSEDSKWLYLAGLTFGIGFLNKYNIAFLLLGLLPAICLTEHRKIFRDKHFYIVIGISLLLILPNLLWQINNGFPVFVHLKTLADTQLVNVDRLDFLKEQLLFFSGSLLVVLTGLVSFFTQRFRKYLLFFFTYLFTILIFVYFRAKSYYSIGLYPVFLAFGAVYLERVLASGWRRFLRPVFVLSPVITMVLIYDIVLPVLSPQQITEKSEKFKKLDLTRWEDGKVYDIPQDFADMLGWRELAAIVDSTYAKIENKQNTIVHCDNYGQAGAINYYSEMLLSDAVSMSADYINWYPLDEFEIENVILVKNVVDVDPGRSREQALFDSVTLTGEIKNQYAREKGTRVFLLTGARQSINDLLRAEIQYRKNRQ
jgi:hypothetical protein